ncbi:MAG: Hint domain-containing protein [Roseovarius sp.]
MPAYISEYSYFGFSDTEFIEVAVPVGTDTSGYSVVNYQSDGTAIETWGLGTVQSTTAGYDVYVIDSATPGFNTMDGSGEIWADDAIALVDDSGTVIHFLSHEGFTVTAVDGPAAGMTSTNTGAVVNMGDSMETQDRGASYQPQTSPNKGTIACYGPGTLIDTPIGPRPVEQLKIGDMVMTCSGPKPIVWVWAGDQPLEASREDQKPVEIKPGALGPGRPRQTLVVSCQHRILVGGRGALGGVVIDEVLVPAKALTKLVGIRFMKGKRRMRWHHFALHDHSLVRANGAWSESLLLGRMVMSGMDPPDRMMLFRHFTPPRGTYEFNGPAARPCLSAGETRKMLASAQRPCTA